MSTYDQFKNFARTLTRRDSDEIKAKFTTNKYKANNSNSENNPNDYLDDDTSIRNNSNKSHLNDSRSALMQQLQHSSSHNSILLAAKQGPLINNTGNNAD